MKRFFLAPQTALKQLETPSIYHIVRDELYELDEESVRFLTSCASAEGCLAPESAFTDYCREEGLLTEDPVRTRRPPLEPAPAPSLRYLELQITSRCNLRCRHCYIGDNTPRELPPGTIRTVLEQFEELQGLRVLITGGEPVLHAEFDAINALLPDFAVRKVLFSNGVGLRPELLAQLNVQELQISIDGMQAAHDELRGRGTWDLAVDALRRIRDAGLDASVATMVTSRNLGDFDHMERLFRSLGVREWSVDAPCLAGRMAENSALAAPPETAGALLGYGYGGGMHASSQGFGCGLHLMAVLPDGGAAKCTFYADRPVGTVAEGLRACWSRVRPIRLEHLDCDCDFRDACRGGCRYRAEQGGSPASRDPYRCALYGVIDKPADAC